MVVDSQRSSKQNHDNRNLESSIEAETSNGLEDFPPLKSISSSIGTNGGRSENPSSTIWKSFPNPKPIIKDPSMVLQPSAVVDGKKVVRFSTKDFTDNIRKCKDYVVGFFVGKKMPFSVVEEATSEIWNLKNEVTISFHNRTTYIFDFKSSEDRKMVLEQGSIYISKSLFILKPWSPMIEKNISESKTIPLWVLVYGVPLHFWNKLGLSKIASFLGTPIMADDYTVNKTRLSYARLCIEIDQDFTYPSSIPLLIDDSLKMELQVEYQWKPPSCEVCKTFGHSPSRCPKQKSVWVLKKTQGGTKELLNSSLNHSINSKNGGDGNINKEILEFTSVNQGNQQAEITSDNQGNQQEAEIPSDNQGNQQEAKIGEGLLDNTTNKDGFKEQTYFRKRKKAVKNDGMTVHELPLIRNSFDILAKEFETDFVEFPSTTEEEIIEEELQSSNMEMASSEVSNILIVTDKSKQPMPVLTGCSTPTAILSNDSCRKENSVEFLPAEMDLSKVTIRKKKKKKRNVKDLGLVSNSVSSNQLTQDRNPETKSNNSPTKEAEINAKIDSQIAFNKLLGISDHPMMRSMCRDLFEKNENSHSETQYSSIEDDGMGDFDPDSDYDEKIEALSGTFDDENVELEE